MGASHQHLRGIPPRQAGADGHAVAEALGGGDDVRHGRGVLVGEVAPGAAIAGLHFVEHEQPVVGVADGAQGVEVAGVRDDDAALAEDRFHQHGGDVLVVGGDLLDGWHVVVGRTDEAGQERLEAGLRLAVAGGRERRHGAPVEAAVHDHHARCGDVPAVAVETGDLDGRFVRFGAGVAEEDVVHAGDGAQPAGKAFLGRNAVEVGRVQQRRCLLGNRRGHLGMGVAEAADGDARQGVEVCLAGVVVESGAFAARERYGQAGVGGHDRGGNVR